MNDLNDIPKHQNTKKTLTMDPYLSGWIGGIIGSLASYPFDTILTIQQNLNQKPGQIFKSIYKHEQMRGFYQGSWGPVMLIGPSNALLFGTYHTLYVTWALDKLNEGSYDYFIKVFCAGALSGGAHILMQTPLELGKTIMQFQHKCLVPKEGCRNIHFVGFFDALIHEFMHYGVRGVYRGFLPVLCRDVPNGGIYAVTYEYLSHIYFKNWNVSQSTKEGLSGGVAGIISQNSVIPFNVIKARVQADNPEKPRYNGFIDAIKKIYAEEGILSFFRGYEMMTIRVFVMNGCATIVYQLMLNE